MTGKKHLHISNQFKEKNNVHQVVYVSLQIK